MKKQNNKTKQKQTNKYIALVDQSEHEQLQNTQFTLNKQELTVCSHYGDIVKSYINILYLWI